ncbi:unnamed protein product [Strongylus vulgaris]|uniref:Cytochrome P450 n=1 Tax=Strongylus vulgaris TaxID=40348 RepID=A0A3P7IG27_STRVU|nr:unnamed protein product [Strongylus vulgaris]
MQNRHPYAYIPFSAVLSWFFRRYSIKSEVAHEENIPLPEIILRPSLGFPVKISRR